MDITGAIAIIFFFSCTFGILYMYFSTRHRERMAMIERGMESGLRKPPPDARKALKEGMQWVAVAVGLGIGYLIEANTTVDAPWPYFGGIAFCVGVASIIYHAMFRRKDDRTSGEYPLRDAA